MTAHPKKDPKTGEMFAFRYGPVPPFLTYFTLDAEGEKRPDLGMSPMDMIIGGGSPLGSDPATVPMIGVLPRYATDEP
ncbi:hypothetical protein QJS10_CPA10g01234 [Acorus calamus]|uniref:Uncharacterized protein n=1 Tax=Acorus calamus TaxID=4465 RepID=A0AAV9E420_ACOCL|nr:hypothetical protein QJS10_CPA10g01234 [Acorus calamus]